MFANYTLNFKKIKGLDPPGPRPPGLTPRCLAPKGRHLSMSNLSLYTISSFCNNPLYLYNTYIYI